MFLGAILLFPYGFVLGSQGHENFPKALALEYAPWPTDCPSGSLTRTANSICDLEQNWARSRKLRAANALSDWLGRTDPAFEAQSSYPTLALSVSGGGLRSLLTGAGIIKAFDSREENVGTNGLLQALTYVSGLSGGSWLFSSLAANNFPTVSTLQNQLWTAAFGAGILSLGNAKKIRIANDVLRKQKAGFNVTLVDPWARLLSLKLVGGNDAIAPMRLSDISGLSQFLNFSMPLPIITAVGATPGQPTTSENMINYEFTPFEFGSWDNDVAAFVNLTYLGSDLVNGEPTSSTSCVKNYDNLGYIFGTSSSLFNVKPSPFNPFTLSLLKSILNTSHPFDSVQDEYATYPNPFKGIASPSSTISDLPSLKLVDGGESGQWNPIWPFLHRDVDVLIVSDNSNSKFSKNLPTGDKLRNTYLQAGTHGLSRMPFIPSTDTIVAHGLNERPTFFGCEESSAMTIIYLPNFPYTFPSNQLWTRFQYNAASTASMIENGVAVATLNGNTTWPTCLACGIMMKSSGNLPDACTLCFDEFCYKSSDDGNST